MVSRGVETRGEPKGVMDPGVECGIAMCGVALGPAVGCDGNGAEACEESGGMGGGADGTCGMAAFRATVG